MNQTPSTIERAADAAEAGFLAVIPWALAVALIVFLIAALS